MKWLPAMMAGKDYKDACFQTALGLTFLVAFLPLGLWASLVVFQQFGLLVAGVFIFLVVAQSYSVYQHFVASQ